ncbi:PDR/VanB family oxidoreductase [Marinospirillum alkaliphilum]|uniref:Vanillate O-demethylase ferredoxin subunit n=1 Tax=Marinospirillum alkaliphilum DSM 21637 TaxID=1122209 RepID=A0A1K1W4D0_9GAMM|nr:PDR/VanB family oxidoreductase [Marinospirillum alkaliphilum]SFX32222.1 vanillate O-demethylase ferredoxin subunit [Marinospirillum alkaliphilum DSM 21637]
MKKTSLSMMVQVLQKKTLATDIVQFDLVDPHGRELPPFTAGAHIDVQVNSEHLRQYSLCNNPADRHCYRIAVQREHPSRGGSLAMHEQVQEGDLLQISAPRNHFALNPDASHTLLVAGGIGITPILAMAKELHQNGRSFELHYSARTPEQAAFVTELESSPFADRVIFHFTRAGKSQRINLADLSANPRPGVHFHVCGPEAFNEAVIHACKQAGWPAEQLHTEYFVGSTVDSGTDDCFEVQLARSGINLTIPADRSVAEVLIDHDVDLLTSCEQGICGTCITRVLDGIPEHRDRYLTEEEKATNDCFTPCCSRSRSRVLVLDL